MGRLLDTLPAQVTEPNNNEQYERKKNEPDRASLDPEHALHQLETGHFDERVHHRSRV
jgi:hypothetical protein